MSGSRIMVDLETLGNVPGSVICALGAVKFDTELGVYASFYERISQASCVRLGLTMDADTVLWWMQQAEAARAELWAPGRWPLADVLTGFSMWAGEVSELWGCGASFDCALLAAAYRAAAVPPPWKFWQERCFRTTKSWLRGADSLEPSRAGTHHHALDDAAHQARWLLGIEAKLTESRGLAGLVRMIASEGTAG